MKKSKTKYKNPGKIFQKKETKGTEFNNNENSEEEKPVKVISNKKMTDAAFADLYTLLDLQDFISEDEIADFMERYNRGEFAEQLRKLKKNQSPEKNAQDLIYRAFQTSSKSKKIKLAKEALSISELCSDAYNILADEEANSFEEAKKLYLKGIEAGEKYMKMRNKNIPEGELWADFESRPYLRSLFGLAELYLENQYYKESIEIHYQILKLNKADNLGARFILVFTLIALNRIEEAKKLIYQYQNDEALEFLFAEFIIKALENGYSEITRRYYKSVFNHNVFMLKYLVFEIKKFPKKMPEGFVPGDEDEAVTAIFNAFPALFKNPIVILLYYLFSLEQMSKELPDNKEILNEIEYLKKQILDDKSDNNMSIYRSEDDGS